MGPMPAKWILALLVLLDQNTLRALVLSRWGTVLCPILLGLISTLGFAPFNLWPVLLGAFSLLLVQISAQVRAIRVFTILMCYYPTLLTVSFTWLQYTMGEYSGIPGALSGLIIVVSALYVSLYYALSLTLGFRLLSLIHI